MYSIINSNNNYYNPESIQIQITKDNKCIIQSILNNKNSPPILNNSLNLNNPQNNMNNYNNLSNGQNFNNENCQNYNNKEEINNIGCEDKLLISFSNLSEFAKTNINNNSMIDKDNKEFLKTSSVCNYLDFTPNGNTNTINDNNYSNILNNEIKQRNLNYIFNILNSDNKKNIENDNNNKIGDSHPSFSNQKSFYDNSYLNFQNKINHINSTKSNNSKKQNNYIIENMNNINIINNKNKIENLKMENVKNIQITNNKNFDIYKNHTDNLNIYKNISKHLSNFSFGINNFNIINPTNNFKNNNLNCINEENNIIVNNESGNGNNVNENIIPTFSPKFNEQKVDISKIYNKMKNYRITHLDLSDINNNNLFKYKDNNSIINYYNNLKMGHGFPSFSIIDKKQKYKNYKKIKYYGVVTENDKIKNHLKNHNPNIINKKSKYVNSTGKLINRNQNNYRNNNTVRVNKEKEKIGYLSYINSQKSKNYSSNKKKNKNINVAFLSKNIFPNTEEMVVNNNINTFKKNGGEIKYTNQNSNNNNKNNLRKIKYFEKNKKNFENNNEKNKKIIDENLKEKIQNILGKNIKFILFKNLLNTKLNNKNHSNSEKKTLNTNSKGLNNNMMKNSYNSNNNSFNNNINNNTNIKCNSESHLNNNDKMRYNIKPSCLIKDNKNFRKINRNKEIKKNKNCINNSFKTNKFKTFISLSSIKYVFSKL